MWAARPPPRGTEVQRTRPRCPTAAAGHHLLHPFPLIFHPTPPHLQLRHVVAAAHVRHHRVPPPARAHALLPDAAGLHRKVEVAGGERLLLLQPLLLHATPRLLQHLHQPAA